MALRSSLTKNPNLGSGRKQYLLDGKPHGPIYSTQSKEQMRVVYPSKKSDSTVRTRKNSSSPFLTIIRSSHYVTQENIDAQNEIAALTDGNPHFAVDIFVGEREDGNLKYTRREIKNGFSLDQTERLNEYLRSGKMTVAELSNEFDELGRVVKKEINDRGLSHGDIYAGNIIIDTEKKTLVLTDWENASKPAGRLHPGEDEWIGTVKYIVLNQVRQEPHPEGSIPVQPTSMAPQHYGFGAPYGSGTSSMAPPSGFNVPHYKHAQPSGSSVAALLSRRESYDEFDYAQLHTSTNTSEWHSPAQTTVGAQANLGYTQPTQQSSLVQPLEASSGEALRPTKKPKKPQLLLSELMKNLIPFSFSRKDDKDRSRGGDGAFVRRK